VLGTALVNAAAGGNQAAVVIAPGRAPELKQALALGEGGAGIRVGIDENMNVVERRQQTDLLGTQHAVAEHVTGHVTNADHSERLRLRIVPQFAEVALDRLPGATGGNAHALVVITG